MPPNQRGGAKDHLKETKYIPDVGNADEMMDKVSFYFISCHGENDMESLMIVPENTFLIFVGSSGFTVLGRTAKFIDDAGVKNGDKLLCPDFSDGLTKDQKMANYRADLFRNFFEGKYDMFRQYPGMQIFCPGDLVQNNNIQFHTESKYNTMIFSGVYEFPVSKDETLGIFNKHHYDSPLKDKFNYIIAHLDTDPRLREAFDGAAVKAEYAPVFEEALKIPDIKKRIVEAQDAILRKGFMFGLVSEVMPALFKNHKALDEYFNRVCYTQPGNVLITQGISANPPKETTLSRILHTVKTRKPYRFFVFGGCRGPSTYFSPLPPSLPNACVPFMSHRTLGKNIHPLIRHSRRLSFSAKETARDVCAIGKAPPFNLGPIKELLSDTAAFAKAKADMAEYEVFLAVLNEKRKSYEQVYEPFEFLLRALQFVFDFSVAPIQYKPYISQNLLGNIANTLLEPSLFLAGKEPKYAESRVFFGKLMKLLRNIFGKFMMDVREEYGENVEAPEGPYIGQLIAKAAGVSPVSYLAAVASSIDPHELVKAEDDFYRELDSERAVAIIEARNKRAFSLFQSKYEPKLREKFKPLKEVVLESRAFFAALESELQKGARSNVRPEQTLERERRHLGYLKTGTIGDFKTSKNFIPYHDNIEHVWEYEDEIMSIPGLIRVIPSIQAILAPYRKLCDEMKKQIRLYAQFKRMYERRVGELELQIQENLEQRASRPHSKGRTGRRSGSRSSSRISSKPRGGGWTRRGIMKFTN